MTTFGDLPLPLAVVAAALLVAYLALFPAAFAVLVVRFVRSFGPIGLLLARPAWVATELGRQYVWDGFPWELLGYSQVTWLPVAQIASLVGVYGLSALLALTLRGCALAILDRSAAMPALDRRCAHGCCSSWARHVLGRVAAGGLAR